jgi:tryptophanyl-tRNA synthetase
LPGTDGRKMSKNHDNAIGLLDDPREIQDTVAGILTDSSPRHAPKHPDWGEAKAALSVLIAETFSDARARHQQLHNNPD